MLARVTGVLLAVSILATACGGSSRSGAISHYIDQANLVEGRLAAPLLEISKVNRQFARGNTRAPVVLAKLRRSDRTIRRLGRELAAVEAPKEAEHLRALLLEVNGREVALVREVEELAIFLPAFGRAVAPLGPASVDLKKALGAKAKLSTKIEALEVYRTRLEAVTVRLRPLRPPPSSRPVWTQQRSTIARVRAAAEALATALREKRAKQVPRLLHDFDQAAVGNQTRAAQTARIEAVRAYNARIKRLNTLGVAIAREEARLQASVR